MVDAWCPQEMNVKSQSAPMLNRYLSRGSDLSYAHSRKETIRRKKEKSMRLALARESRNGDLMDAVDE